MPTVAEMIAEIHEAIEQLHAAALHDRDVSRGKTAENLRRQFQGIDDPIELRACAASALHLYSGGMGSFQDAGTAVMDDAVTRLRLALTQAVS